MLRTTRQYTEVLSNGTGKLRTTRQYVEVLSGFPPASSNEFLTSSISFGQSVSAGHCANIAVSSAATLDSHVVGGKIYSRIVGNTVAFSQDAYRVYGALSGVAFGQILVSQLVHQGSLESDLALGQSLLVHVVHNVNVSSALQTVTSAFDIPTETFVDTIVGLDCSVTSSRIPGAPEGFHQSIQFQSHVGAVRIKASAISASASSSISFGQTLAKNQVGSGINTVQFGQSLQADNCKPLTSSISFDSSVTVVSVRNLNVSNAIEFDQSAPYRVLTIGILDQYHPFIGDGDIGPDVALNGPMPGVTAPFQLVYPADGVVTDSVTLRTPDFGNKDKLSFNRISRETRGGTLIVYADPIWPKIQTLVLSFSAMRRFQAQALLSFLDNYLGQEIGLIDWEHRYWKGIIISPENPVIQDAKDSFSASFSFEGQLDPTRSPLIIPVIQEAPANPVSVDSEFSQSCPAPAAPVGPFSATEEIISATADEDMLVGQVVYVSSSGHVALAMADAIPEAGAVGVLTADVANTYTAQYILDGLLTMSDWTAVIGTQYLSPGAIYWLSDSVSGGMSSVAPTMGFVVPIGRALSQTQFKIEIQESVKL